MIEIYTAVVRSSKEARGEPCTHKTAARNATICPDCGHTIQKAIRPGLAHAHQRKAEQSGNA